MASSKNDKRSRQARAEQMRKERERADARRRNGITIGVVVVVVALIAVAGFAIKNEVDQNNAPAASPSGVTGGVGVTYDAEAAGGKAAGGDPVKVVLYEDFQCPGCQAFESANRDFLQQQVKSGDITIEYRPIAFLDRMSSTNYSTRALNAAACVLDAKGVKAFHAMHDLLYKNQPPEGGEGLSDDQLSQLASQAGAPDAGSCISDAKFKSWTEDVTQKADDAGVQSTPTVKIDGETVSGQGGGVPTQQDMQAAIQKAAK